MKYKKGDDIYLKGQIVGVSSCSEVPFPYEVLIADGFISAREEEIVSVNEPEKPILSKEEAEWLEGLIKFEKPWGQSIYNTYPGELYPDDLKERFVKAVLYGYEIEKEKLYTVKFSNEDFGKTYIGIIKTANKIGISTVPLNDECSKCYFTKSELEEFKFWNNTAFEIEEV